MTGFGIHKLVGLAGIFVDPHGQFTWFFTHCNSYDHCQKAWYHNPSLVSNFNLTKSMNFHIIWLKFW